MRTDPTIISLNFTASSFKKRISKKALDAIELSFQVIDKNRSSNKASKITDDAIEELNFRFKEAWWFGYQFTNKQIVRIDSEYIHAEIVKPSLKLLNQEQFSGAQQEFLNAHEHYRKGNAKEALNECLKAFESTMKRDLREKGLEL